MVLGLLGGHVLLCRCSMLAGRANSQNQVQHFTDLIYFLRSTRVQIPSTHNAYIYLDLSSFNPSWVHTNTSCVKCLVKCVQHDHNLNPIGFYLIQIIE